MGNSNNSNKCNTTIVEVDSNPILSPLLMDIHQQPPQDATLISAVDCKGRPAIRSQHGRCRSAAFIIVVEMAERLSYYGISGNLITFLTGKLGQSTATAAANVNAWGGVASLLPILGGLIADSFLGKFYTIILASLLYILGLGLLTLSAMLPFNCVDNTMGATSTEGCTPHMQIILFFVALYLVAVGQGGHKPCVQAFGADQFDANDPNESKAKSSFFNWWYVGVCLGGLLGIAVLSYVQDNYSWGLGFGIPCIIMVVALLIFLLGTMTYRYMAKGEGPSPFLRVGRVFVDAAKNWRASHSSLDSKDEEQMTQTQRGSRQFRFLDKALLGNDPSKGAGESCSLSDVEEAKAMLRLFPIWVTSLIFAIIFSQQNTFFTKQGVTLDRSIGPNFKVPPAALQSLIGICIVIIVPIYDRVFVPIARSFTGKPAGITLLQRIGTGLFISIVTMVTAALVERRRLHVAIEHGLVDSPKATVPMSVWWLVPQYALFGTAEAFTMVGLQEFFYDQVPNELRSVGMSLYLSIFGVGSLLSSLLVSIINKTTQRGGGEGWFSNNLNRAHLDYFYWLLAGLSVFGLICFIWSAKFYIYKKKHTRL